MKKALLFLIAFLAVITVAGCINYGVSIKAWFYVVVALLSIVGTGYLIVKEWKQTE